mmetsp:Transcript_5779/g.10349  ORF Transcript_5779/g.10349 Transcript_5779/m.10349 type:complete len:234 (-) Transcript_5779:35-736(-)
MFPPQAIQCANCCRTCVPRHGALRHLLGSRRGSVARRCADCAPLSNTFRDTRATPSRSQVLTLQLASEVRAFPQLCEVPRVHLAPSQRLLVRSKALQEGYKSPYFRPAVQTQPDQRGFLRRYNNVEKHATDGATRPAAARAKQVMRYRKYYSSCLLITPRRKSPCWCRRAAARGEKPPLHLGDRAERTNVQMTTTMRLSCAAQALSSRVRETDENYKPLRLTRDALCAAVNSA